ncbi:MAG: tetratricopeptide repeat protein [Endomicrobiaceae bacterium]|jgi:tetratricopeptide (TPR) repeat protein|nr:tetratricopeptide repeat protein [Endomicrobiaceae bacterium]
MNIKNLNYKISLAVTILFFLSSGIVYFVKNKHYSVDNFLNKANSYFINENFLQSARYYRKLISMGFVDENVYINISNSLIKLGDYKKAKDYLKEALNNHPSSELYYLLGYTYYAKLQISFLHEDAEESIKYLQKSIEMDKKNKLSYRLIGQIYEQSKNFEYARIWYKKALIEHIENISEFYGFIAYTYFEESRWDEAIQYYKKAIDDNKNYISAYCSMGEIYRIKKDFVNAEQYYKQVISINPDYVLPYYKIGNIYYEQENYQEAVKWYQKGLEKEANNNMINYYIGMSYKKLNMVPEAVRYLKTAAYCGNDDAVEELRSMIKTF